MFLDARRNFVAAARHPRKQPPIKTKLPIISKFSFLQYFPRNFMNETINVDTDNNLMGHQQAIPSCSR